MHDTGLLGCAGNTPAQLRAVENSCGLRRKCRLFAYGFPAARAFTRA